MGRAALDFGNFALFGRAWYRIPDNNEDDDNPNEHRFLGYGDVRAIWTPNRNTFTAMIRPGTESVGYEITWSYPISKVLRVYAQWFNGYGESLIDYDRRVNRWGIGLAMTDYLMQNN
jgi:phospholipase A1